MRVAESLSLSSTHVILPSSTLPSFNLYRIKASSFNTVKLKLRITTCSANPDKKTHQTCKNCKSQFDPCLNHPLACRFHTAHFGGETKRKFESVYTGVTMNTPDSGQVFQYWHCCGSEDPFDPGCTSSPHMSYDD